MNKEQFLGILRHSLTFLGGILVLRGNLDNDGLEQIIGSTVTLVGLVWSYWIKK